MAGWINHSGHKMKISGDGGQVVRPALSFIVYTLTVCCPARVVKKCLDEVAVACQTFFATVEWPAA
jgi:hypothetical protein